MTNERKDPTPRPHGRFERWLDLVMERAGVAKSLEQPTPIPAYRRADADDVAS